MPRQNPRHIKSAIRGSFYLGVLYELAYVTLGLWGHGVSAAAFSLATMPGLLVFLAKAGTNTPGMPLRDREAVTEKGQKVIVVTLLAALMATLTVKANANQAYGLVLAGVAAVPIWTNMLEIWAIYRRNFDRVSFANRRHSYDVQRATADRARHRKSDGAPFPTVDGAENAAT